VTQPHAHHAHHPHPVAVPGFSLLRASALTRLGMVAAASFTLWSVVALALDWL
jgi:hypothetical protein